MKLTKRCSALQAVGLIVVSLFATVEEGEAALDYGVTGSVDLTRYSDGGSGTIGWVDTPGIDLIRYEPGRRIASVTYNSVTSTINFVPGPGFNTFSDLGTGNSLITLSNLNAQGDNWASIASDPQGAAISLVSSDVLTIDYAPIFANGGNASIQLSSSPAAPSVPASGSTMLMLGSSCLLLGVSRRLRRKSC